MSLLLDSCMKDCGDTAICGALALHEYNGLYSELSQVLGTGFVRTLASFFHIPWVYHSLTA
jgi:hypothetical protein